MTDITKDNILVSEDEVKALSGWDQDFHTSQSEAIAPALKGHANDSGAI